MWPWENFLVRNHHFSIHPCLVSPAAGMAQQGRKMIDSGPWQVTREELNVGQMAVARPTDSQSCPALGLDPGEFASLKVTKSKSNPEAF